MCFKLKETILSITFSKIVCDFVVIQYFRLQLKNFTTDEDGSRSKILVSEDSNTFCVKKEKERYRNYLIDKLT